VSVSSTTKKYDVSRKHITFVFIFCPLTCSRKNGDWLFPEILKFTKLYSFIACIYFRIRSIITQHIPMDESSGGSRSGLFEGNWNRWRQKRIHLFRYPRFSATIVEHHTKVVVRFVDQESGYFCCSNYVIFQGITTAWKRFVSIIHKTLEVGPKRRGLVFHKLHITENIVGVPNLSTKSI